MFVFLFVAGEYIINCLPGVACVDVIGNPAIIIAAGGFEFFCEIIGVKVYRKKVGK